MNEAQRLKLIPSVSELCSGPSIRLSQIVAGRRNQELENMGKPNLPQFDLIELLEQSLIILRSQRSLASDLPHAPEALRPTTAGFDTPRASRRKSKFLTSLLRCYARVEKQFFL